MTIILYGKETLVMEGGCYGDSYRMRSGEENIMKMRVKAWLQGARK